jgi:hypothetical protein
MVRMALTSGALERAVSRFTVSVESFAEAAFSLFPPQLTITTAAAIIMITFLILLIIYR